MNDVLVTIGHCRRAGLCVRGIKPWCALHGIDFRAFLLNGIPASTLEKINDPLAMRAVAAARQADEKKG